MTKKCAAGIFFGLILTFFLCTVADAQTYYVATNGVDSRHRGITRNRSTPWKSIQVALNRAERGSTIVVLDGMYWGQFEFRRNNVTLRSERKEGAFIVGSINANDLSGVTIDGFEISNRRADAPRTKGISINRGDNINVRNCRIHDCRGGGISIDQSDQILCEWNVVYRNAFWDPDQHSGISIYQPQNRTADALGFDVIVRNNTSFSNENKVNNVLFGRPTDGNGIVIDDSQNLTGPTGNNQLYSGSILVENNLCYNNGGQGVHCYQSENVTIRNNTLYRNMRSFDFGGEVSVVRGNNVLVFNNILCANTNKYAALRFEGGFVWFDYNLIHRGDTPGVNNGRNTIFAVPSFDPNGFFDLRASSPGVDAGLTQRGRFLWDVDGKDRIVNGAIDIGAKEVPF